MSSYEDETGVKLIIIIIIHLSRLRKYAWIKLVYSASVTN